jgi:hypothetical protein
MEVSYDAIRRMIQDEIQKIMSKDDNPFLTQYVNDEDSTRNYCKRLVRGELSNEFVQSLNRIEKASKGALKEEAGGRDISARKDSTKKSKGMVPRSTRIKISKSKSKIQDDVIEDEVDKPSKGEITDRRDDLFGGWKDFRQQAKLIYSTSESFERANERWKKYLEAFNAQV